ncbi:MAG: hypothetical protein IPN59_11570, partial [Holophaga sp.]|nr:hypothetical protein [Holophaga sp.]
PTWLRRPLGFLVELLAAIPSVIYGLWGVFVLSPWLRDSIQPFFAKAFGWTPFFEGTPRGFGMMAGVLILAIRFCPPSPRSVGMCWRLCPIQFGKAPWPLVHALGNGAKSGVPCASLAWWGRDPGVRAPWAKPLAVTMVIGNRADISFSLVQPFAHLGQRLGTNTPKPRVISTTLP